MKTTVTKSTLKEALDKLNTVPGCTHGAGDTVTLVASEKSLRVVRATSLGFGDITVDAAGEGWNAEVGFARLRQAVGGMSAENVELDRSESDVIVKGGGRVTLKRLPQEIAMATMMGVTKNDAQPVLIDGKRLAEDFTAAMRCADRKESREFLRCVHVIQEGDTQRIVGASSKAMVARVVPEKLGTASVPPEHADLLIGALPSCNMMTVLSNRVEVSGDDCRFSVGIMEVAEKGYSQLSSIYAKQPLNSDPAFRVNVSEFQSAVRAASSFALDGYDGVDVEIHKDHGTASVTTRTGESCAFNFTAKCRKEFKVRALGLYLESALKAIPVESATIYFHDQFMLLCEEGDTKLIFMLMRTEPTTNTK